jgi:hypothetical protein
MTIGRDRATGTVDGVDRLGLLLMHIFQASNGLALLLAGAFSEMPALMGVGLLVFVISAIAICVVMR